MWKNRHAVMLNVFYFYLFLGWNDETDVLHTSNLEKMKSLENLNEQLVLLAKLLVKKEKFIISGDELRKNIHVEVENFAEMNGVRQFFCFIF